MQQSGTTVTGTFNDLTIVGSFTENALLLDYTGTDGKLRITARVSGETMTGQYLTGEELEQVYPLEATRQQPQ